MDNKRTFSHNDGVYLKELFNSQIDNLKMLIDANDKNYNQRFENVIQATKSALDAADRAVNKAEMASEKRFDAVNEFRATLSDQQRTLMPRNEAELMIKSINEKVDALNLTTIARQSEKQGIGQGWGYAVGVVGLISLIVSCILRFVK